MLPAWQVTDAGDLSLAISHFQKPLPQRDFIQLVTGDGCFLKKYVWWRRWNKKKLMVAY